jgi:hypothetical protein
VYQKSENVQEVARRHFPLLTLVFLQEHPVGIAVGNRGATQQQQQGIVTQAISHYNIRTQTTTNNSLNSTTAIPLVIATHCIEVIMSLIKSLSREKAGDIGDSGSNSSNGGGSGNNSDNSALVSLGNTSFGFNFDSEEGNQSPGNSNNSEEGDSDGSGARRRKPNTGGAAKPSQAQTVSSSSTASIPSDVSTSMSSHSDAAAAAVANLQSIANESIKNAENGTYNKTVCWL